MEERRILKIHFQGGCHAGIDQSHPIGGCSAGRGYF